MRTLTGTVLPLVLVYTAVLVLLFAARRPPVRGERRVRGPVSALVSIGVGGFALFASAMTVYCGAQGAGAATCVRTSLAEAAVLAASTSGAGVVAVFVDAKKVR
jgi:hypothetical protein